MVENLNVVLNREYWISQKGDRVFPHEFKDEHLANTIRYLHKVVNKYRLEEARNMCELVRRTGHESADINNYYYAYRREMDNFLGDLNDKQWLKQNSKIYNLLIEEATYRNVDYSDKPIKVKYTGNVESKYKKSSKLWSYLFSC